MSTQDRTFLSPDIFKSKIVLLFFILVFAAPSMAQDLVWPKPPEQARIKYLYSFSKPSDLKLKRKNSPRFFDFLFGREKGDIDGLLRPQGVWSGGGRILITDTALKCVHIFDTNKKEYYKISKIGRGSLVLPVAVAADKNGKIYVSDSALKKLFSFTANGDFIGEIGKGRLKRPCGIAINDSTQRIYVVDTTAGSVNVFGFGGDFLFSFGAKGNLNSPTYLSLDQKGRVYVADSLNFKVQIFSADGKAIDYFGKMGRIPGTFSLPKGIALDSDQNIYVTDSSFDNVQIFNQQGELMLYWGESGNGAGQFWLPAGIAVDEYDKAYVVDPYNGRIQVFQYIK